MKLKLLAVVLATGFLAGCINLPEWGVTTFVGPPSGQFCADYPICP